MCLGHAKRRNFHGRVLDQFHEYPSGTKHHAHTEGFLARQPGDGLHSPADRLLHQHAIQAGFGFVAPRRGHDLVERLAHRAFVRQAQPDATGFGFVRQVGRFDLQHHGISQMGRRGDRGIRAVGRTLASDCHAVRGEKRFGFALGERCA